MAVKSLSAIKQETGRDLTNQTADTTLVFAELANGTAGAATVGEITKNCLKEIPDDVLTTSDVVDTVASENMAPVSSNAVNGALAELSATKIVNKTDANDCLPSANKTETFFVNSAGNNLPKANNYVIVANRIGIDTETRRYSQMAYRVADGALTNDIYTRIAIKGTSDANITFSNWEKLTTESDLNYKLSNIPKAGISLTDCNNAPIGFACSNNVAHTPNATTGYVYVLTLNFDNNPLYQYQMCFQISNNNIFTRVKVNGTWGNWAPR